MIERDIVFVDRLGFRPVSLDLHLPQSSDSGPSPVVVFVHGGGWRTGSRRVFCPGIPDTRTFGRVTAAGFAVAAIDYRLSGEAVFPAAVDDVLAALTWLGEAGPAHGLDPTRTVLWGESAGAHLAALAAMAAPRALDAAEPFPPATVRGVVDWYGPADLTRLGTHLDPEHPEHFDDATDTREAGLLGGAPSQVPDRARAASPALVVRRGAPPFFIAHGVDDDLVPIAQSRGFATALERAGVPVELTAVPGARHFWRGADDTDALFDAAIAFARRVTGG